MEIDHLNEDTIAAISSAQGIGGIAVVRVSGKLSLNILKNIFRRTGSARVDHMESHKLYRGQILDKDNNVLDDVLCVIMKSPNSYTGEDVVEIHSHGGLLIPKIILEQCIIFGARISRPGEFTCRAFLNGKMDLLQAEAVAGIIDSQTELALKHSQTQLQGKLSSKIKYIRDIILDMLAEIEANVDFPEEEIDPIIRNSMIKNTNELINDLADLLSTYHTGRLVKKGLSTVIIGKPNVGKSSLLNNLISTDRAIVSHIPGTTRDFIEEFIDIRGIPLKLIDTAGLRISNNKIEMTGIEITKRKIEQAELILVVLDTSGELTAEDRRVLKYTDDHKSIVILNKCDLPSKITKEIIIREHSDARIVETSAKHGINIKLLKDLIFDTITDNQVTTDTDGIVISDLRHKISIEKANTNLNRFINLLNAGESPEYLSIDLRCAMDALGEIIGETSTEEILGKIFSKFCIGK